MSAYAHPALAPGELAGLTLRNRIIKTATYEGVSPGGRVAPALVEHHAAMARGGVAMTTLAYCSVSSTGRTFKNQLVMDERTAGELRALTDAVHEEGALASIQLSHCGGFTKLRTPGGGRGPSRAVNAYGLASGVPWVKPMRADDLRRTIDEFATAAARAVAAGFDALEIHCGHGYLLSQFLSPVFNRRRDEWGGAIEARLRLPVAVVRAVREAVGPGVPLLAKFNLRDGVRGGLELDEAVTVATALADAGIDALVPSGGLVQKSAFYLLRGDVPAREMARAQENRVEGLAMRALMPVLVRAWDYTPGFFMDDACAVLDAIGGRIPVVLLGGVDRASLIRAALERGFSYVAMGRALLADPDFIARLADGEDVTSRCTHCNLCVAEMDRGGVRCVPFAGGE